MRIVAKVSGDLRNFVQNSSTGLRCRVFSKMSALSDSIDSLKCDEHVERVKRIQEFIPKLNPNLHKGQCGRIGIVGGSFEYSGAPYFAAISSLKLGADLVHVFCSKDAGPVIKSYSPELIIHPILDSNDIINHIEQWLGRLHALVIGPGLGRNPGILQNATKILIYCKKNLRPPPALIIDADGIHLLTEDLTILKGYLGPIVLTPNVAEYSRLSSKIPESSSLKIATHFNSILLEKGQEDIITNGFHSSKYMFDELTVMCNVPGSNRRCGGQGDVLAGCVATFVGWLQIHLKNEIHYDFNKMTSEDYTADKVEYLKNNFMLYTLAVYGACVVTRTSSKMAYDTHGRAMTASDLIANIEKAFKIHFGQ